MSNSSSVVKDEIVSPLFITRQITNSAIVNIDMPLTGNFIPYKDGNHNQYYSKASLTDSHNMDLHLATEAYANRVLVYIHKLLFMLNFIELKEKLRSATKVTLKKAHPQLIAGQFEHRTLCTRKTLKKRQIQR